MVRNNTRVLIALTLIATACGGDDGASADASTSQGDAALAPDGGSESGWRSLATIPTGPIQETAAVEVAGLIYVIGGIHGTRGTVPDVLTYNIAGDSWSQVAPLPTSVHHANAAVVGGKIYVVGSLAANFQAIDAVWEYDPAGDEWITVGTMPAGTERGASAVGVIDGVIYVAGGLRQLSSVNDFSSYDPAMDAWNTTLPDMPQALDHLAGEVVDGTFYLVGGRQGGISGIESRVDAFAPGGGWMSKMPMPTARGGVASGVVNGQIVIVGGEGNPASGSQGVFPQAELYSPGSDTWSALPNMLTPRHGMAAVGYEGVLYVPGGADEEGIGAVDTNEAFVF